MLVLLSGLQVNAQLFQDSLLTPDGYRDYFIRVPDNYTGTTPVPLVIGFHGGNSTPGTFIYVQSKLHTKANTEGFIAVFPFGSEGNFGRAWNAGDCCDSASINNVDDIGFTEQIIDVISATYNIDADRVYATGFSNGASMTYRIGCELADRIAAIAPVSNRIIYPACAPTCAVPVIHFHALDDTIAHYNGGTSPFYPTVNFPSVDSTINLWRGFNNCPASPSTILNTNGIFAQRWGTCSDSSDVILYQLPIGGHTWSEGNVSDSLVQTTDLIWDFFSSHTLKCTPAGTHEIAVSSKIKLYPNPTSGDIYLQADQMLTQPHVLIRNLEGKVLQEQKLQSGTNFQLQLDVPAGIYLMELRSSEQPPRCLKVIRTVD